MEKKSFGRKSLKTAIVFGSSGLTGNALLNQLCALSKYNEIICINRTHQKIDLPNCKEVIDDFSDLNVLVQKIKADEVYCCLGTTIKKAGSEANFSKVDLNLPVAIAYACQKNGVKHFLVVSSVGAKANSRNFYLRIKGIMEIAVLKMSIPQITIVRPSMLLGERKEVRLGEGIGKILMKGAGLLLFGKLKKYKAIHVDDVAKAMIIIANSSPTKQQIFESNELQEIVDAEK